MLFLVMLFFDMFFMLFVLLFLLYHPFDLQGLLGPLDQYFLDLLFLPLILFVQEFLQVVLL